VIFVRFCVKQSLNRLGCLSFSVLQQWLDESKELESQIVEISVENSYPTPFTSMVAYETTQAKKDEQEHKSDADAAAAKKSSNVWIVYGIVVQAGCFNLIWCCCCI